MNTKEITNKSFYILYFLNNKKVIVEECEKPDGTKIGIIRHSDLNAYGPGNSMARVWYETAYPLNANNRLITCETFENFMEEHMEMFL